MGSQLQPCFEGGVERWPVVTRSPLIILFWWSEAIALFSQGDLAKIYGVETRVLNQAVKRHRERFPADFTFRLSRDEAVLSPLRGENIEYLPYVFTEHGAVMVANVNRL